MNTKQPVALSELTTLGVGGVGNNFHVIDDSENLPQVLNGNTSEVVVIGEGSNLLFSDMTHNNLIIKMLTKGIEVIKEDDYFVYVSVAAGENWDEFVDYTISNSWWGIENMSLIPGSVGACPVQNVGAYGQDCRQVIDFVKVFDIANHKFISIPGSECEFGFRSSIFNKQRKNQYIIVNVVFKLSKVAQPCVTRPVVKKVVSEWNDPLSLQRAIRDAIVKERCNGINLPVDDNLGCSGTFFRTSIVSKSQLIRVLFKTLINLGPRTAMLVAGFCWKYRSQDGCKLPSKFLINSCGASSIKTKSVFLYQTNPAVLTTYLNENPSSSEVLRVIQLVRQAVYNKTGVKVPIEPTLIGFTEEEISNAFEL